MVLNDMQLLLLLLLLLAELADMSRRPAQYVTKAQLAN